MAKLENYISMKSINKRQSIRKCSILQRSIE